MCWRIDVYNIYNPDANVTEITLESGELRNCQQSLHVGVTYGDASRCLMYDHCHWERYTELRCFNTALYAMLHIGRRSTLRCSTAPGMYLIQHVLTPSAPLIVLILNRTKTNKWNGLRKDNPESQTHLKDRKRHDNLFSSIARGISAQ